MKIEKLAKMANEIGDFFAADPDPKAAVDGFIGHLSRFWEPRMRRELLAWIDQGGGSELSEFVRTAVIERRDALQPRG